MSQESDLLAVLEKEFFTEEFFAEEALVEELLECFSSERFNAIKEKTGPNIFKNMYVTANFVDNDAKRFTEAELVKMFDSLPTLASSEEEFI